MKPTLYCLLIILCVVSPHIYAADLVRGQAVYEHHCWECHGDGALKIGTKSLTIKYRELKPAVLDQRTDMTPEFVKLFVRNGVGMMLKFRKTEITDVELDDLAAYLAQNYRAPGEAADFSGEWNVEAESFMPMGPKFQVFALSLEQDGGDATGLFGDDPVEATITGDEINFTIQRNIMGRTMEFQYRGRIRGSQIDGTYSMAMGSNRWSAKRKRQ